MGARLLALKFPLDLTNKDTFLNRPLAVENTVSIHGKIDHSGHRVSVSSVWPRLMLLFIPFRGELSRESSVIIATG